MDTKEQYRRYLLSDHWQGLRARALLRDGERCRRCGSERGLEVHHMFYRRLWVMTLLEDLLTMCWQCHERSHRILDTPLPRFEPGPAKEQEAGPLVRGWTNKQFSQSLSRKQRKAKRFFAKTKKNRAKARLKRWKNR